MHMCAFESFLNRICGFPFSIFHLNQFDFSFSLTFTFCRMCFSFSLFLLICLICRITLHIYVDIILCFMCVCFHDNHSFFLHKKIIYICICDPKKIRVPFSHFAFFCQLLLYFSFSFSFSFDNEIAWYESTGSGFCGAMTILTDIICDMTWCDVMRCRW